MARKKYITSHSNYVLKKQHSITNNGVIYERDYMTLTPLSTIASDQIKIYGEGNFKLSVGNGVNRRIKHNYGEWETFVPSTDINNISKEGKIVLNPNYSSLLDFAYYGSCVSLIESSLMNIIKNYPGELYFGQRQLLFIDSNGKNKKLGGNDMYIVENPFLIDILDDGFENTDNVKAFLSNIDKYNVINSTSNLLQGEIKITRYSKIVNKIDKCPENNTKIGEIKLILSNNSEIVLHIYFYEGEKYILYRYNTDKGDTNLFETHIRLKNEEIDKIFRKFSDFERILLNRESNPIYKAILDTPQETPNGVVISKKSYILPTNGGWNIDITSSKYSTYINDLLSIATFYDEYYTDNIWRMLTHTSIKNMDNSFVSLKNDEDIDDFVLGGGRIEKILKIYGRQYDDIKRYIQNIKVTNNITYDRKNNIPDYFLTDALNVSGWEALNVAPTEDVKITTDILFPQSEKKQYNSIDANTGLLRFLKLNSKYLLSLKGTKLGIETILKLFGMTSDDFIINEYVAIASNKTNTRSNDVKLYNKYKKTYYSDDINGEIEDELQGLPIKEVIYTKNGVNNSYLIPWFDKNLYYDGGIYFQMKGGWGKTTEKKINNKNLTDIESIDGISMYDETVKYLHFVNKLEDLTKLNIRNVSNGDIYYVYDISNIDALYKNSNGDYSNYFILKNVNYSYILGSADGNEGWVNISTQSLKNGNTNDAKKVIYLESIIEDSKGNAPHIGYGNYDNGKEYLDYFRNIFKYSIENDNFIEDSAAYSCDTGDLVDEIRYAGFNINENCFDNIKCWYFTNTNNTKNIEALTYDINNDRYIGSNDENVTVGTVDNSNKWDKNIYATSIQPINPENIFKADYDESLKAYDEAAANSIINIKNMDIIIKNNNINFINYFNEKILPYVKQMIPSTTIWNIKFENNNNEDSNNSVISLRNKFELYYKADSKINDFVIGESYFNNNASVTNHEFDNDEGIGVVIFEGEIPSIDELNLLYPNLEIIEINNI